MPRIEVVRGSDDLGEYVELATDAPAYRAASSLGGNEVWSDNGVTLLPGEPRRLRLPRRPTNPRVPALGGLRIDHL